MRVLYLTDSLSDLDGVGRYAVRLITALESLRPDLEVHVLLARKHRPTSREVPPHWKIELALPPDYFFHMARVRFWWSLVSGALRARRATAGIDLVHAIKDYPHSLVGLLAARSAGVPCVATAHGTYSVQPLLSRRHARLCRWAYNRFAAVVCVSEHTKGRLLQALGNEPADGARLVVVKNAVDAAHYAERRQIGPRPWHGLRYSLGIGELKERKGHHLALEAWVQVAPRFPELHHFVVGKASGDAYQAHLESIAGRSGLSDRVHFLGNVSEDEKVDLLQRAEVFLHTPVNAADGGFEGFGIVYLEASASGVPCIGTLGSGAEDAVDDGVTGLLAPARADAVAQSLAAICSDKELALRMGNAGRERARKETWRDNARAVLGVYERATSQRTGAQQR